jgi:eukaryotic-like serine/threonine-protein kinase
MERQLGNSWRALAAFVALKVVSCFVGNGAMHVSQQSAKDVFLDALEITSVDARREYVEKRCEGDPNLRSEVERLLDHHARLDGFLASKAEPPVDPSPVAQQRGAGEISAEHRLATIDMPAPPEDPGAQIGPYKLLQKIGEGGFGVVYVAEQEQPVARKVALKIIKPGMDTRDVIARFEAERQALALMDHPNIAKVLDAGTTGEPGASATGASDPRTPVAHAPGSPGRPYFVMELVRGVPITEFCDERKLSTRERLQLFIDVCRAVQHAHQKGIIHRDLKPSNVMVTLHDDKPVVKVIDFGVAKALSSKLTEKTVYTAYGQMIGTPLYMSPEQAQLTGLDVDTRSDMYSLGVLLYELLTGSTPFDKETLKNAGFDEMRRIIREVEPPRPSARISTLNADLLSTISDMHHIDPRKLSHSLRGELDWIVMKALEKDRNRRYETASAFAADVERYLADEPVQARPASAWYRLRKFARRNKRLLFAVGFMATALLLGTLVSTWQALRATQAEEVAQKRLEAEQEARRTAHETVEEFFTRVSENRLLDEPGLQPLRKELLEAAVTYYERLADRDSDDPQGQADLAVASLRLAQIYYQTGFGERHISALEKALGLVEKLIREHPAASELHLRLAGFWHGGRTMSSAPISGQHTHSDMSSALRVYQAAAALWEKLAERYPAVTGFKSDLSKFYDLQGNMQRYLKQNVEALHTTRKVCEIREEIVRANPGVYEHVAELCNAYVTLARTLETRDPQAAEKLYRRAVTLEKDAPDVATYQEFLGLHQEALGLFLARQKRAGEARRVLQQGIVVFEKLAARFPQVNSYRSQLQYWREEVRKLRPDTAAAQKDVRPSPKPSHEQALALLKRLKADDAPAALYATATLYRQAGDAVRAGKAPQATRKAEEAYRTAILLFEKLAAEEPTAINRREELADCYYKLGELLTDTHPKQAEKAFRQALPIRRKLIVRSPGRAAELWLALTLHRLAYVLRGLGQFAEARQLLEEAILHQPDRGHREWHYYDLALVLLLLGEHRQAAKAAADLVQDAPDDARRQLLAADLLARCMDAVVNDAKLSEANRKAAARLYGDRAVEYAHRAVILLEKVGTDSPDVAKRRWELAKGLCVVGSLLWAAGRKQAGEKQFRAGLTLAEKAIDQGDGSAGSRLELADRYIDLGHALAAADQPTKAEREYRRAVAIVKKRYAGSPGNPTNREYLAGTINNLGVLLAATGRYREAEQSFRRALQLQEKLAADTPKRPYFRQELAGSHFNLGMALAASGRPEEAERAFRQALAIREKLLTEVPGDDWQGPFGLARVYTGLLQNNIAGRHFSHSALASTLHQLARLSHDRSNFADADRFLERALGHEQAALEFNPPSENYRRFLLNMYAGTLQTLIHLEDKPEARRKQTPSFPDVWEEYYRAAGSLAGCGSSVEKDDDLYAVERKALAQVGTNRVTQLLQRALKCSKRHPKRPLGQNGLAWRLATHPKPEFRDPDRAVQLARTAVELAPNDGYIWNTLGVAQYRAGDWKAAISALEKSMKLRNGGDAFDWFFLAMADWQLGRKQQARAWYGKAVAWMEKQHVKKEELRRFRAEAEKLMGIKRSSTVGAPSSREKPRRKPVAARKPKHN